MEIQTRTVCVRPVEAEILEKGVWHTLVRRHILRKDQNRRKKAKYVQTWGRAVGMNRVQMRVLEWELVDGVVSLVK